MHLPDPLCGWCGLAATHHHSQCKTPGQPSLFAEHAASQLEKALEKIARVIPVAALSRDVRAVGSRVCLRGCGLLRAGAEAAAGVPGARGNQETLNPCEMEPSCAEIKSGRLFESAETGSGGGCEMELALGHACL